jgi:hypothetical protein
MSKPGKLAAMPGMAIPAGMGGGPKPLSRVMFDKYDTIGKGHINAKGFQQYALHFSFFNPLIFNLIIMMMVFLIFMIEIIIILILILILIKNSYLTFVLPVFAMIWVTSLTMPRSKLP